ncbi:MAG TPA: hypothetical protein ENJ63_00435 [Dissulfuribacter thermophilus]|uniref:Uncharacterized protein n=1 Tax=Dissulfuribacter thermophilus TaxID=1156395 RepID=A0A7V2WSJ8_9BACT|nr:hypothetical protein [Dissulfuribacter thermophilus]
MEMVDPIDLSGFKTVSLYERKSKVELETFSRPPFKGMTFREFMDSLPDILGARDLKAFSKAVVEARRNGRPFMVGMGAHLIKVGLNPVIIHLMEQGIITSISQNGACIIHDFELAASGRTSEDVQTALGDGSFGNARETGEFLNECAKEAKRDGIGFGEAVGRAIFKGDFPYKDYSIAYNCYKLKIPLTVHVAIGTDIVHIHPSASGEAIGAATFTDFRRFCTLVSRLEGGVYANIGSAVLMPEVFLKALTLVRNLGYKVERIVTANFDFIRQYRPLTNVVQRPTSCGGAGYSFTGHHEIMIPLFAAMLIEQL